jgi:RNA polymerase sigma-70 factor (ECF subfamily)
VDLTEAAILDSIARGAPEAFQALYDRYSRLAYTVAMRILNDEATAEDVVQDAFLSVWQRSSTYRPDRGSVRAWICTIVRNRAIDRLRGESGRARYELSLDRTLDEPSLSDTWAEVLASLERERIGRALQDLPPEQRQTIELAYWSGMSHTEIGRAMRVPLGTVKGRARLAMGKLREALQGREELWQQS